ncbi:NUDIX domain-containing protein [Candidatus Saccharibacteria bacterium]|nr:MAG: NUDIX domain-containing protein [Candidatus Saccharibacteria bacterium]
MSEINKQKEHVICRSELIALGGAIPVAAGIIVLEKGLGSRPVSDLSRLPDTASIVVAVSRARKEYTLPGGKKDSGDLSLQYTCRRELEEELGIIPAYFPEFYTRDVGPAVHDPTILVDVSAYRITNFLGNIRRCGEIDDVAAVPVFDTSPPVRLGGLVLDVLDSLRLAA